MQTLREKVKGINDPIRALVEYSKGYEWEDLVKSVHRVYEELAVAIYAFRKSLYQQKHAFYFRRLHEWDEHNKVRLWIN